MTESAPPFPSKNHLQRNSSPRAFDALRQKHFRRFWLAALVSNTGSWMQGAAIPFVAFSLTGSAGAIGVTGFFQYLPFMMMGLVGGSLADRFPRRTLLIGTQVAQAICAVALFVMVYTGFVSTAWLAGLAFASGLAAGLNTPVWQSFVTELVSRDLLLNAVTLNSAQFNAARALGPLLTGIIASGIGVAWVFALNAASFGLVIIVLFTIRVSSDAARKKVADGSRAGIRTAGRYVLASPPIIACCMAIAAVAGFGSPLFSYLVVYGEEVVHVSGLRLGILFGAAGIGSVLFTPALLSVAPRIPRSKLLSGAMVLYGFSVIAAGLAPTYVTLVLALLCFGGAYLAIASTINTTIQLVVRDDLRGKVLAIYLGCLTGALPLGIFAWGRLSDSYGIQAVTVAAGCALLLITFLFIVTRRFHVMADADLARDAAAAAKNLATDNLRPDVANG
ncbi:MAG: MFS transporter [Actinomycetes bacterium]